MLHFYNIFMALKSVLSEKVKHHNPTLPRVFNIFQVYQYFTIYRQYFLLKLE